MPTIESVRALASLGAARFLVPPSTKTAVCAPAGQSGSTWLGRPFHYASRLSFALLDQEAVLGQLGGPSSSRIHTGVMPRPDHFTDLSFFDWYFGFAFARLPARPLLGVTAFAAALAFLET
jgi:hypothetical protein